MFHDKIMMYQRLWRTLRFGRCKCKRGHQQKKKKKKRRLNRGCRGIGRKKIKMNAKLTDRLISKPVFLSLLLHNQSLQHPLPASLHAFNTT
jgi:hypothetical protein